jgi:hypothetical protein
LDLTSKFKNPYQNIDLNDRDGDYLNGSGDISDDLERGDYEWNQPSAESRIYREGLRPKELARSLNLRIDPYSLGAKSKKRLTLLNQSYN